MKPLAFVITLLSVLLLTTPASFAQSIKKKGWIVLNNGDTLRGFTIATGKKIR